MIYLDNNATTRVDPEVIEAMRPFLDELYANPSSNYSFGRKARAAVETAREQVANLLGAEKTSEIVFNSGGSEGDNLAIRSALALQPDKRHIVTTTVEHEAVRNVCQNLATEGYEMTWLTVDGEGALDLDQLRSALRPDTALVTIMLAQNETGILFPMAEIGRIVREHSAALFHVDGVQATGKIPLDLRSTEVDFFVLSGHKLYAPKGVGALYVRDGVKLSPMVVGGAQELGRRAGTEAVPNIVALGKACELAAAHLDDTHTRALRDHLEDSILTNFPNAARNGTSDRTLRLPNTASISFAYLEGESIMAHLDDAEIYVSTGSACNSASHTASAVLTAMDIPYTTAMGSIRFSLGRFNTREDIDETILVLTEVIDRLIEMSPYDQELKGLAQAGR
jgi:cysteine desulfurase